MIEQIGVGTVTINKEAKQHIRNILRTGRLSYGPYTQQFEQQFATMHQAKHACMLNSGTDALEIALQAMKETYNWKNNSEVIVPSTTFVATINIIIRNNLKPVFVDIEPNYYGINPYLIEQAITKKTVCILPVHLFGMPCDMDLIMLIARKYKLKVLEDSCETMLAKYNNKYIHGNISCYSTYVAHLISAGVGGITLTNNKTLHNKIRSLMNHGRDLNYITIDDDKNKTQKQLNQIIKKRFHFTSIGHSSRITEFEGALALSQLKDLPQQILKRRLNANYYNQKLSHLTEFIQLPRIRPYAEHSYMMYPIVLLKENKTKLVQHLEQNGIETRDMLPLVNQPIYKKYKLTNKKHPNSHWIVKNGFYIPNHHNLTKKQLKHITNTIHKYYKTKTNKTYINIFF